MMIQPKQEQHQQAAPIIPAKPIAPVVMTTNEQQQPKFDKPVPGSTIRCLEDPNFSTDKGSALNATTRPLGATCEVVEEARDRFDRYWSKPATDDHDTTKTITK